MLHHGRTDWGKAKVLLERTSRVHDGVLMHLECVYGEGNLRLRGGEGGGVHGVVERVVV
jgi:hypothetical protein